MEQYISKSAIVKEIEKRVKGLENCHADTIAGYAGEISGLKRLLSFLGTIGVKEMDLDKEIETQWNKFVDSEGEVEQFSNIAKYFFELGLKTKEK